MAKTPRNRDFQTKKVLGRQPPQYSLGEPVVFRYLVKKKGKQEEHYNRGFITGVALNPPGTILDGWWYQVDFYESTEDKLDSSSYLDTYFYEDDLEKDPGVKLRFL